MDDVASAAYKYLSGVTAVTSLLGSFPGSDAVAVNRGKPYLFKDEMIVLLQGTQAACIVLSAMGSWNTADDLVTPRYPRLSVDIYVDPLRAAGNVLETAGATKGRGETLFTTLNHYLHRTDPQPQIWGDMVTTSCKLMAAPQFALIVGQNEGDRQVHGQAFYAVSFFGYTDAVS